MPTRALPLELAWPSRTLADWLCSAGARAGVETMRNTLDGEALRRALLNASRHVDPPLNPPRLTVP